jgi:hypothetical protein
MNFISALKALDEGKRARRKLWTEIQFIFIVSGSTFNVNRAPLIDMFDEGTLIDYNPHIDASFTDGTIGVWTVSQNDLFAKDWDISES